VVRENKIIEQNWNLEQLMLKNATSASNRFEKDLFSRRVSANVLSPPYIPYMLADV
jgi:hypothetical protein